MRDASLNPSFSISRLAVHLTLWGACALYLVPLLVMLLTSFKTPDDIRTGNLLSLPDTFTVISDSFEATHVSGLLRQALTE